MTDRQPEDTAAEGSEEGSRMLLQLVKSQSVKPAPRKNPLQSAMESMILDLSNLPIPRLPTPTCYPENMERLGEHLLDLANIVDRYILTAGIELRHHISPLAKVDVPQYFSTVVTSALGEAACECRRAAQILREERAGW